MNKTDGNAFYTNTNPRNYRYCLDKNNTVQKTPSSSSSNYENKYFSSYPTSTKNERFDEIQMEKIFSYEKLLANLGSLSAVMNNFLHILQNVLNMNIDTLFTDYSFTNITEIDFRLQDILEMLFKRMNLSQKEVTEEFNVTYDKNKNYYLYDKEKELRNLNVNDEEIDPKFIDQIKLKNKNFIKKPKARKFKKLAKEKVDISICLSNCNKEISYQIKLYSAFSNYPEENLIYSSQFELPSSEGFLFIPVSIPVEVFYERKQYLKFEIFKKESKRKYTIKFPMMRILKSENEKIQEIYEKENSEKIILKTGFIDKPKERAFLDIRLKSNKISDDSKSKFYFTLSKLEDPVAHKLFQIYRSEEKAFDNKNSIDFTIFSLNAVDLVRKENITPAEYEGKNYTVKIHKKGLKDKEVIELKELKVSLNELIHSNPFNFWISENLGLCIDLKMNKEFSFFEFLKSGLSINMSIAIDFTKSNGDFRKKSSLHYFSKNFENHYEKAIKICGQIVGQYDSDKIYPVYGYGAIVPNQSKVSHCFNLNLSEDPNIKTIEKVLDVYHENIQKLIFKFPTNFAHIIKKVIKESKANLKNTIKNYEIILIMTDGKFDDSQATIDAIVEASYYPISILIIGIGDRNFDNMNVLEIDDAILTDSNGKRALRDIVQFVPFSKYENNTGQLAEFIFEEIPEQVIEYFSYKNISPDFLSKAK